MAGPFVSLNGIPVVHGTILIPYSGIWTADLVVGDPTVDMTGLLTLSLSGTIYSCTAIRNIVYTGARGMRVVGGMAGWRRVIPPRQYANGVLLGTVLRDAAAAVLEQVNVTEDEQIGTMYIRRQGPASQALNDLLGKNWYMDPLGVVQTGARSVLPIVSEFIAMTVTGSDGCYTIATEDVGSWTPGRSFIGPTASATISRVEHKIQKGQLRTVVLAS